MDFADDLDQADMVGVIKIKDGLFIGDAAGAQVSSLSTRFKSKGVPGCKSL